MNYYNSPNHYTYGSSVSPPRSRMNRSTYQPQPLYIPRHSSSYQSSPISPRPPRRAHPPAYKSYHYNSDLALYSGDWSIDDFIALGSYNEEPQNKISIVTPNPSNDYTLELLAEAEVKMPPTRIQTQLVSNSIKLLSSGDSLTLWNLDVFNRELVQQCTFSKPTSSIQSTPPPLTSFDWCRSDPSKVITSSVDTTCTLWDIHTQSVQTQLISHDSEVFDVKFVPTDPSQFVSVGADGSARLFDLRSLNSSTIIYEHMMSHPLLRIKANPNDGNMFATFGLDDNTVQIIDIRSTRNPLSVIHGHQAQINGIAWVPKGKGLLATCSDDCQILISDTYQSKIMAAYTDIQQVNNILVSPKGDWIGSLSGKSLQGIKLQ